VSSVSVSSLFTDNNHILIHITWKPYQVFVHYKEAAANALNSLQCVLVHCLAESIHTCNCVSSFGYCWKMGSQIFFTYHSELIWAQKNIRPLKYTSTFVLRYCPSDIILKKKLCAVSHHSSTQRQWNLTVDTSQEHILSDWQKSIGHLVLQYWPEYMTTLHLRWFCFIIYIFQENTYTEHIHFCVIIRWNLICQVLHGAKKLLSCTGVNTVLQW